MKQVKKWTVDLYVCDGDKHCKSFDHYTASEFLEGEIDGILKSTEVSVMFVSQIGFPEMYVCLKTICAPYFRYK